MIDIEEDLDCPSGFEGAGDESRIDFRAAVWDGPDGVGGDCVNSVQPIYNQAQGHVGLAEVVDPANDQEGLRQRVAWGSDDCPEIQHGDRAAMDHHGTAFEVRSRQGQDDIVKRTYLGYARKGYAVAVTAEVEEKERPRLR